MPLLQRIVALPHSATTHGRTHDNPHSPADFREAMDMLYAGTRLGRQQLEGLLLEDVPGALWTRELLDRSRIPLLWKGGARGAFRRRRTKHRPKAPRFAR